MWFPVLNGSNCHSTSVHMGLWTLSRTGWFVYVWTGLWVEFKCGWGLSVSGGVGGVVGLDKDSG